MNFEAKLVISSSNLTNLFAKSLIIGTSDFMLSKHIPSIRVPKFAIKIVQRYYSISLPPTKSKNPAAAPKITANSSTQAPY